MRLYPLFQEAHKRLDYPEGYFNDRLIAGIDHLLAIPQITVQVFLYQPKVLDRHLYTDPGLEALSLGRKILLRIGTENATQTEPMLLEYRLEPEPHKYRPSSKSWTFIIYHELQ